MPHASPDQRAHREQYGGRVGPRPEGDRAFERNQGAHEAEDEQRRVRFREALGDDGERHADEKKARIETKHQQRPGGCGEHESDTRGTPDHTSTLLGG